MNVFTTRITITHDFEPDTNMSNDIDGFIGEFLNDFQDRYGTVLTPMVECFINMEPTYLEINGNVSEEV